MMELKASWGIRAELTDFRQQALVSHLAGECQPSSANPSGLVGPGFGPTQSLAARAGRAKRPMLQIPSIGRENSTTAERWLAQEVLTLS